MEISKFTPHSKIRPVLLIKDEKVLVRYGSLKEASLGTGLNKTTLQNRIKRGTAVNGITYMYEPEQAKPITESKNKIINEYARKCFERKPYGI